MVTENLKMYMFSVGVNVTSSRLLHRYNFVTRLCTEKFGPYYSMP